jgi:LEA14-like dessication related protein
MKRTCIILPLIALALPLGGCGMLDAFARPTAEVVGVELVDVDMTSATLLFDVQVDNPYSVPLPLVDADYALASQGVEFLTGDADLSGSIPAGESAVVPLPARLDFLQLLAALDGVAPGDVVPYDADLGLFVDAPILGTLRLPMTQSGQVTIPSASDLNLPANPDDLIDLLNRYR